MSGGKRIVWQRCITVLEMDTEHTLSLIPDYALGLLAAEERRRVEAHARLCPACRAVLQREQRVGALLRDAARSITPPPGRLAALRPALPAPHPRPAPFAARLAPLTLAVAMLVMGLLFASGRLPGAPAVFATAETPTQTATSTHTPTATLAAAMPLPTPQSTPRP